MIIIFIQFVLVIMIILFGVVFIFLLSLLCCSPVTRDEDLTAFSCGFLDPSLVLSTLLHRGLHCHITQVETGSRHHGNWQLVSSCHSSSKTSKKNLCCQEVFKYVSGFMEGEYRSEEQQQLNLIGIIISGRKRKDAEMECSETWN